MDTLFNDLCQKIGLSDGDMPSILLEAAQCDIIVMQAEKDFFYEAGLTNAKTYLEDGSQSLGASFKKFLDKVLDAVLNVIQNALTTITNLFKKDRITEEEFMKSDAHMVMLDQDYEKLLKDVHEQMLKGNKILQKISSATKIDVHAVEEFVKDAEIITKMKKKYKNPTLMQIYRMPDIFRDMKVEESLKQQEHDMHLLYDTCLKSIKEPEQQKAATKVMSAASKMVNHCIASIHSLLKKSTPKKK